MTRLSHQDLNELKSLAQKLTITNPVEQAVIDDARAGIILSGATQRYQAQLYRQFKALTHIEEALSLLENDNTVVDHFQLEKTNKTGTIILEAVPRNKKIAILKVVRSVTGLGLKEAKEIVESTPYSFLEIFEFEKAQEVAEQLNVAGAKVSIRLTV